MAGQREKKLNRLLDKAEQLFWNYGFNAVSVDRIAAEAGISKMTLYKYFNSKEDLFIDIYKRNVEYYIGRIQELIDEKYHTIDKIEALYAHSLKVAKEYPAVLIRDIVEKKTIYERVLAIKLEKGLPIWKNILEDGIRKGEIRKLDLFFISELLMNLPAAFKDSEYLKDKGKMLEFYDNFIDFIKFGLLGGTGGAGNAEKRSDESRECK